MILDENIAGNFIVLRVASESRRQPLLAFSMKASRVRIWSTSP